MTTTNDEMPFITAICPTYRRPKLIPNVLAMWNAQTYPKEKRILLILDDGQSFESQINLDEGWILLSINLRIKTLGAKFNLLVDSAIQQSDIVLFEDDDVYLPGYVEAHAKILKEHHSSQPEFVWSNDAQGRTTLNKSNAVGRHHGAWGFSKEAYDEVGGYYGTMNHGFDTNLGSRFLALNHYPQDPFKERIEYIYRWQTSGYSNGSGWGDDIYEATERCHKPTKFEGELKPEFDEETAYYYSLYEMGNI